MSDLSEIHEKINATQILIARVDERLATTIPTLATREDLSAAIVEHKSKCRSSSAPPSNNTSNASLVKVISALVGAITVLGGVIAWLVH